MQVNSDHMLWSYSTLARDDAPPLSRGARAGYVDLAQLGENVRGRQTGFSCSTPKYSGDALGFTV
ncbi:hypothetical protein C8Q78DRAFT_1048583 [Trametes maxima]|nr:hypothetical protein C8Q78DRAFT_1048583 [Trametes maxima]